MPPGQFPLEQELNPDALKVGTAFVEPSLADVSSGDSFQFERQGFFFG